MAKKIQRSAPRAAGASAPASERAAPSDAPVSPRRRRGRIRPGQVTDFTIQLATLTEAGIPIVKALREGIEDVYPGEIAQEWLDRWRDNPKVLERELAAGGG